MRDGCQNIRILILIAIHALNGARYVWVMVFASVGVVLMLALILLLGEQRGRMCRSEIS